MPSPNVQEYLDSLPEDEFREREAHYRRHHPLAERRTFIEFLESIDVGNDLYQLSCADHQGREHRAHRAANGFGGFDYIGNSISSPRKGRDRRYASGSSHGNSAHRGTVGRDYEARYGNELFAGEVNGLRPGGGSGSHGARTQSWAPNPYGPSHRGPRFSTEDPADFGGRDNGHQAAPPARRSEMSRGERSTAQSSLADASSRHYGGRQDPRSHDRYGSHDDWNANFGDSSGGHGGRHTRAGRHH